MDSSTGAIGAAIAGYGAASAVGLGVQALEEAVRKNSSGLRPCPRFSHKGYQTGVVGALAAETWQRVLDAAGPDAPSPPWAVALAALREAMCPLDALWRRVPPSRVSLVLSTTKADVAALEEAMSAAPPSGARARHILPGALAADLAQAVAAGGPVRAVSVACVSGLVALQLGARLIERAEADAALVVGVDLVSHFVLSGFTVLKSLDPEGCRPFDQHRGGLSLGEGAGAVVLVRPDLCPEAQVLLTGWGTSNDANHLTGPSRDGSGLAAAIRRALRRAGANAAGIDYIHAHGTGTLYNDNMESLALRLAFGEHVPPFSSSKGMLGHTLGAAGILETILCCVAARAGILPGTPGLRDRDPVAPPSLLAEPAHGRPIRRLLKMNAGFGGTNGALVLEVRA